MRIEPTEIRRIIVRMIAMHPEYIVRRGEPYFVEERDTYRFSSHHFIEQYRAIHPIPYSILLVSCWFSRRGVDRNAHGQIGACLSRYSEDHRSGLTKIGRIELSRDVHGNMVRPMWWIFRE